MAILPRLLNNIKELTTKQINVNSNQDMGVTRLGFGTNIPEDRQAVYPAWFFASTLGQPRSYDPVKLRNLSQSSWVQMVLNTFKKEISTIEWRIVPVDEDDGIDHKEDIKTVTEFLNNINDNNQCVNDINSEVVTDLGELDAGVWNYVYSSDSYTLGDVPVYDAYGRVAETELGLLLKPLGQRTLIKIQSVDAASMLKQVDIHKNLLNYYQYSFKHPRQNPTRFEKDEITYLLMNSKSYSIYGFCMPWDSVIETNTGKEKIGEIVSQKKDVSVKTYNEEKKIFEYKKIKNYFSRYYNDHLYKIRIADGNKNYNVRCTKEHPILTERGFVKAEDVTLNDNVMVRGTSLTKDQRAFLLGTLLGDGNVACKRNKGYPYFQTLYKKSNKYYLDWIRKSLGNLNFKYSEITSASPHYPDRIYDYCKVQSKIQPCLDGIRRLTYPDYKKKACKEWVDELTPLSIAAWMMDDGSICKKQGKITGFTFCTDYFSTEECNLFVDYFKKHNIKVRIMCPPSTGLNRLWMNQYDLKTLLELVKDYFIIDEDIKKKWIAEPLRCNAEETGIPIPITTIEKTNKKGWQVFDIEVEDNHNFIANRVIVHNSPVQSIQQVLELLIQSTRFNKDFFTKNAIPEMLVGLEGIKGHELKKLKRLWNNEYAGKHHQVGFISWAISKIHRLTDSNKDMEWLDGQKWFFKIVFAAFGVSPTEAGFFENANQSNDEGQARVTVRNAIKPHLELLSRYHTNKTIVEILQKEKPGLKFKFFPKDHAQEKIEHEQHKWEVENGAMTINDYRALQGKEPYDWGDEPFKKPGQETNLNFNNPLNPLSPQETEGSEDDKNKEKTFKKSFEVFMSDRDPNPGTA